MKMLVLKKGYKYRLVFNVGGKILTYTGTMVSCDEDFLTFKDKFDKEYTYNLNTLVSSEELKRGVVDERY